VGGGPYKSPVYAWKGLVWNSPRGPGEGFLYKKFFLRACQQVHLWSVIRESYFGLCVGFLAGVCEETRIRRWSWI
jgi:hypothetical protein